MQRVRVGLTGLAAVVMVIAIFTLVYSSASREAATASVGAANASVVANLTGASNTSVEKNRDEPLAELGVAPGTETDTPADTDQPTQDETAPR